MQKESESLFSSAKEKAKKSSAMRKRGWPATSTGMPHAGSMQSHLRWRRRLALPEETPEFSDRDVFDVIDCLLARKPAQDLPPLVVKALQRGTDSLDH